MILTASLADAMTACAWLALACWLVGLLTREHIWPDRLTPVVPTAYVLWFSTHADHRNARLLLMLCVSALCGLVYTQAFARAGGYSPGAPDRWRTVRERIGPWPFQLTVSPVVCAVQNALLLALASPAWAALSFRRTPLRALDLLPVALSAALLVAVRTVRARWFRTRAFAPAMAFAFYLFGVSAGAPWLNPTLVGTIGITVVVLAMRSTSP